MSANLSMSYHSSYVSSLPLYGIVTFKVYRSGGGIFHHNAFIGGSMCYSLSFISRLPI